MGTGHNMERSSFKDRGITTTFSLLSLLTSPSSLFMSDTLAWNSPFNLFLSV